MYKRNGLYTRKNTHETAVSPVDAKSSFLQARRAPVRLEVDFAYNKEMASRREKVRTVKPFLSETRSHHSSGRSAPRSNQRSTSRISKNGFQTLKNSHEKAISSLDAKSSSFRVLRALVESSVDFAYIKEMASRCEKVRTRKPFLSETRSPFLWPASRPDSINNMSALPLCPFW